jgi:uncharacterized protein YeaO (DUF488 family)
MKTRVKRVYEKPSKSDGARILIDRLWPRGESKENARITFWAKDLAPSAALRKWFHTDPEKRFKEFEQRYRAELRKNKSAVVAAMRPYRAASCTLVTSVKDIEHSHIPTLRAFLEKLPRDLKP